MEHAVQGPNLGLQARDVQVQLGYRLQPLPGGHCGTLQGGQQQARPPQVLLELVRRGRACTGTTP